MKFLISAVNYFEPQHSLKTQKRPLTFINMTIAKVTIHHTAIAPYYTVTGLLMRNAVVRKKKAEIFF